MHRKKNEMIGLVLEISSTVLYIGAVFAVTCLLAR